MQPVGCGAERRGPGPAGPAGGVSVRSRAPRRPANHTLSGSAPQLLGAGSEAQAPCDFSSRLQLFEDADAKNHATRGQNKPAERFLQGPRGVSSPPRLPAAPAAVAMSLVRLDTRRKPPAPPLAGEPPVRPPLPEWPPGLRPQQACTSLRPAPRPCGGAWPLGSPRECGALAGTKQPRGARRGRRPPGLHRLTLHAQGTRVRLGPHLGPPPPSRVISLLP